MSAEIFEKNLFVLGKKDPQLVCAIKANSTKKQRWKKITTKTGLFTLQGVDKEGNDILLHSKYDPLREAQQIVNTYQYAPTADLVLFGFGLGYHVEEVLQRPSKHGLILVVEADIEVFIHACMCRDLSHIFTHPNVVFSVSEETATVFNRLTDHSLSVLANSLSVLVHPTSVKCHADFYAQIRKCLNDFYTWVHVNANTQIAKARDFSRNILANAYEYIKSPGINTFFNVFENVPVFIVSAGPSLDKNVHYLKEVGDRGIIICVDSALKTILDNGIVPDLVVSIDFTQHNNKYFDDIDVETLRLAFDPEVYPEIPAHFQGKKFAINLPGKAICDWMTEKIGDKGCISKGLSVSHSAFSIALAMKSAPIILVGQDLSYPRGAWHSKGSGIYQKAEISAEIKNRLVDIDGYFGGQVRSETSFTVFLSQFESILDGLDVKCYNATEGGACIHGIEPISLRDAIRQFCVDPIDKSSFNTERTIDECIHDCEIFCDASERIVRRLTQANHYAYEAFTLIEKMMHAVQNNQMNKHEVVESYKKVLNTIQIISDDEEVLHILKDNALEALIIRTKREMININDISIEDKEPIIRELQKEKVFFMTLVNACDFLSKEFIKNIALIRSKHVVELV